MIIKAYKDRIEVQFENANEASKYLYRFFKRRLTTNSCVYKKDLDKFETIYIENPRDKKRYPVNFWDSIHSSEHSDVISLAYQKIEKSHNPAYAIGKVNWDASGENAVIIESLIFNYTFKVERIHRWEKQPERFFYSVNEKKITSEKKLKLVTIDRRYNYLDELFEPPYDYKLRHTSHTKDFIPNLTR